MTGFWVLLCLGFFFFFPNESPYTPRAFGARRSPEGRGSERPVACGEQPRGEMCPGKGKGVGRVRAGVGRSREGLCSCREPVRTALRAEAGAG